MLQLDAVDRFHDETAELATRVLQRSQTLPDQWRTDGYAAKRLSLEIVFLNCRLDGVTLVPELTASRSDSVSALVAFWFRTKMSR
jgi:hypothetical protein